MKKILLYLILLLAIGLAGIVAYVSVSGLMKVFTGAGTIGLAFFIIIEVSKVIATSAIHTYGKLIKWYYRVGLTLCIVGSMAITSIGIYGFLSSSYKSSFAEMESVNAKVELLETKRDGYQTQLTTLTTERNSLNNSISELTKGLSNNVIEYKDPETGEIIRTTSSATRRVLEKQLNNAQERLTVVNTKSDSLSNIIFDLENDILEEKLNNEAAQELSTLQYLSDITGKPMDTVMGWLMFIFIILGDPMAVLMVIIFNKVVNLNKKGDEPTPVKPDDPEPVDDTPEDTLDEYPDAETAIENELKGDINTEIDPSVLDTVVETEDNLFDNYPVPEAKVEEPIEEVVEDEPEVEEVIDELEVEEPIIDEPVEPESQIAENKEKLKEAIKSVEEIKQKPSGKIIREDIKEIKQQGSRGYSVDVPHPTNVIQRIGSNKEIRTDEPNKFFFKRPKPRN